MSGYLWNREQFNYQVERENGEKMEWEIKEKK